MTRSTENQHPWPPQFHQDLAELACDIIAYGGAYTLSVKLMEYIADKAAQARENGTALDISASEEALFEIDSTLTLLFALTSPDEWLQVANEVRETYERNLRDDPRHPSWSEYHVPGEDVP